MGLPQYLNASFFTRELLRSLVMTRMVPRIAGGVNTTNVVVLDLEYVHRERGLGATSAVCRMWAVRRRLGVTAWCGRNAHFSPSYTQLLPLAHLLSLCSLMLLFPLLLHPCGWLTPVTGVAPWSWSRYPFPWVHPCEYGTLNDTVLGAVINATRTRIQVLREVFPRASEPTRH